jgi:ribosomal-protein-alanine N-acetyltransferase
MYNNFPILNIDDDYSLRNISLDDAEEFFKYFSHPKVCCHILSKTPKNKLEAQNELNYWLNLFIQKTGIYWAIINKENNKIIGTIGLHEWNKYNNRGEISYDLNHQYWGKNIMSKALYQCLKYLFIELRINRIQAITIKENLNSIKLLQKNNFTFEGVLQKYRFHNEKYYDINIYAILRRNFETIYNL